MIWASDHDVSRVAPCGGSPGPTHSEETHRWARGFQMEPLYSVVSGMTVNLTDTQLCSFSLIFSNFCFKKQPDGTLRTTVVLKWVLPKVDGKHAAAGPTSWKLTSASTVHISKGWSGVVVNEHKRCLNQSDGWKTWQIKNNKYLIFNSCPLRNVAAKWIFESKMLFSYTVFN